MRVTTGTVLTIVAMDQVSTKHTGRSSRGVSLSRREIECFWAEAEHLTPDETARRLGLEAATVRKYLSTGRQKLGARTKREAVRRFLEHYGEDTSNRGTAIGGMVEEQESEASDLPVSRGSLNDIAVDHARMEFERTEPTPEWRSVIEQALREGRPEGLSFATRNMLILFSTVACGAALFLLSVALALVGPLAYSIRALFP